MAVTSSKPRRQGGWIFERRRADKPQPNAEWVAKKIVDPKEYVTMAELVERAKRPMSSSSVKVERNDTKTDRNKTSTEDVCRFFVKTGRCKFGDSCRRLHPSRSSSFSADDESGGSWRRVSSSSSSSSTSSSWRTRSGSKDKRSDTKDKRSNTNDKRSNTNDNKKYYTGSATRQDTTLRPMLDFHNHVKRQLYRKLIRKNSAVLELAGGRGGDLWKLRDCGVSEVMLVDKDDAAVREAEKRWKSRDARQSDFNLRTAVCDLSSCHGMTFRTTKSKLFDFVSCQFALHYFFKSSETFECFQNTLSDSIRKGGTFVLTCFDSHRVRKLLNGRDSVSLCRGALGLETMKGKSDSKVFGHAVKVTVETIGSHEEYLVDTKWLAKNLKGFEHVSTTGFDVYHRSSRIKMRDREMSSFSFLNVVMVFRRV